MTEPGSEARTSQKQALENELRQWLLRARSGDQAAYRKFLERTGSILRAYLHKAAAPGASQGAEDLVQEVLLAIHRKKHMYDENMRILPWIYAIARYRLVDSYRAAARRPRIAERRADNESDFDIENLAVDERDPESAFQAAQSPHGEAAELLAPISEKQRDILLMAKVDEVPLAEIARRHNMSLSAVKVTIHRAIQGIRKRVGRM